MLLAIDFSSIVSSAVASDDQLALSLYLLLTRQTYTHAWKQSTDCPL